MPAEISLFCIHPQDPPDTFPPVSLALAEPNGLLAYGGDLSQARLLAAYRRGIFPWYSEGQPILWWSPDPRTVFEPRQIHVSRSLARAMKRNHYRISHNESFAQVIAACAAPRGSAATENDGSWLLPEVQAAYIQLHETGHAHSVEVWQGERLVGGLYGVDCGSVFCAESMFSHVSNASKMALVELGRYLSLKNYRLIDAQVGSAHLYSMGASEISRDRLLQALNEGT